MGPSLDFFLNCAADPGRRLSEQTGWAVGFPLGDPATQPLLGWEAGHVLHTDWQTGKGLPMFPSLSPTDPGCRPLEKEKSKQIG